MAITPVNPGTEQNPTTWGVEAQTINDNLDFLNPDTAPIQNGTKPVTSGALFAGLATKVNTNGSKQLSDNNYSNADKAKLQAIVEHYRGEYPSLAALQDVIGAPGDYANVDTSGQPLQRYNWDSTDNAWVQGSAGSGAVSSVNGQTGVISLTQDNILSGTNFAQYSKIEQTKLSGIAQNATVYNDAMAITANIGRPLQTIIYQKFWFNDLADFQNDFTVVGDLQVSFSDGKIILSSGSATSFLNYLLLNGKYYNDENIVFEVTYTQTTAASTTTNGLAVGFKSTNNVTAGKQSIVAQYVNTTSPSIATINPETNTSIGGSNVNNAVTHSVGDELTLRLTRSKNTYIAEGINESKATSQALATTNLNPIRKTIKNGNITGFGWANNNTSQLAVYYLGGPVEINRIRIYSTTPKTVWGIFIGDSRVAGSFSKAESLTFANLIGTYYNQNIAVFAGGGDETKDALLAVDNQLALTTAKNLFMLLGLNDILRNVPLETAVANYTSIRNKHKAIGTNVIHYFIPATSADQTTFNAAVKAALPTDKYVEVNAAMGFNPNSMMSVDGSHLTAEGNRFLAKTTISLNVVVN